MGSEQRTVNAPSCQTEDSVGSGDFTDALQALLIMKQPPLGSAVEDKTETLP